jgi:hypothetical protein
MQFAMLLLLLCSGLSEAVQCSISTPSPTVHTCSAARAVERHACLCRLRGGSDDEDVIDDLLDEGDDEDEGDVGSAVAEDALENPFLGGAGGASADGVPGAGFGLEGLSDTLKDPAALQDALKELQDPAVQQQVKAMLEDPSFQESMKQYMEQITKDPQFEALKKQTEQMMQEEGFAEQMSKAFADMAKAVPGGGAGDDDGD